VNLCAFPAPRQDNCQANCQDNCNARGDCRWVKLAADSGLSGIGVVLGLGADRIVTQAGNERGLEKLHTHPNAASPNDAAAAVKLFVRDR